MKRKAMGVETLDECGPSSNSDSSVTMKAT